MTPEKKDSTPNRLGPSADSVRMAQLAMRDISADTTSNGSDRDSLLGAVQDEMRSQAEQAETEVDSSEQLDK